MIDLNFILTAAPSLVKPLELTQQDIRHISEELSKLVEEKQQSLSFLELLSAYSRFHKYSFHNTLLIFWQYPEATYVARYDIWRNYWFRQVQKGQKGIRVIYPVPYTKKDEHGNPIINEKTGKPISGIYFSVGYVFDIKQTEKRTDLNTKQRELAEGVPKQTRNVSRREDAMAIKKDREANGFSVTLSSPDNEQTWVVSWYKPGRWTVLDGASTDSLNVDNEQIELFCKRFLTYLEQRGIPVIGRSLGLAHGQTDGDTIEYSINISLAAKFLVLIHEYVHYQLHWTRIFKMVEGKRQAVKERVVEYSREKKEIQAESVVYVIAKYLGLLEYPEIGERVKSFIVNYIATWQKQENVMDALQNVHALVCEILNVIMPDGDRDTTPVEDAVGEVKIVLPNF